jgi:hypothetical protein
MQIISEFLGKKHQMFAKINKKVQERVWKGALACFKLSGVSIDYLIPKG